MTKKYTEVAQRDDHPHLLTPEAAAQRLGISRSAIYRLLKTGELRSLTIGRSRRIPSEAIRSLIESKTVSDARRAADENAGEV